MLLASADGGNTHVGPALWLGLWGAVLSTLLAAHRFWESRRDRGRLRFRANWQQQYEPSASTAGTTHQVASPPEVIFTVTNVGRRPVLVTGFGIRLKWTISTHSCVGLDYRLFFQKTFLINLPKASGWSSKINCTRLRPEVTTFRPC